jgi:hypothetical protein
MAFKTYAMLGTSAGIADGDLVAIFHGTGPLTSVTAAQVKGYAQAGAALLAASTPFTATQAVSASAAAPAGPVDYLQLKPSDYGAGKPGLFVTKSPTANAWTVSVSDGALGGELDLNVGLLKLPASTAAGATLTLAPGTAPSAPSNGDAWVTGAGFFVRAGGVTTQVGQQVYYLQVRNQTANSANSTESFSSGGWNTRVLNTTPFNNISGASVGSNQLTLPAGTYLVNLVHIPLLSGVSGTTVIQHRLRNITDSATLAISGVDYAYGFNPAQLLAPMLSTFTLAGTKTVELQIYVGGSGVSIQSPGGTAGGEATSWFDLELRKIA